MTGQVPSLPEAPARKAVSDPQRPSGAASSDGKFRSLLADLGGSGPRRPAGDADEGDPGQPDRRIASHGEGSARGAMVRVAIGLPLAAQATERGGHDIGPAAATEEAAFGAVALTEAGVEASSPTEQIAQRVTGALAEELSSALGLAVAAGRLGDGSELAANWASGDLREGPTLRRGSDGQGRSARAERGAEMKLPSFAVTRQETHFAPATSGAANGEPVFDHDGKGVAVGVREGVSPELAAVRRIMMAHRAAADAGGGRAAPGPEAVKAVAGPSEAAMPGFTGADGGSLASLDGPGRPAETERSAPATRIFGATVTAAQGQGGGGPTRVLHIQLHPLELGEVTVKMRLGDAGLELQIEAVRQETVSLLRNDRETLANLLRASGYAPETVTVTLAEKGGSQGPQAAPQDGGARDDGSGQQGGSDAPAERGGDGRSRAGAEARQSDERRQTDEDQGLAPRAGSDLYL